MNARTIIALIALISAPAATQAQDYYMWVSDTGDGDGIIEPGEHAVIDIEMFMTYQHGYLHCWANFDVVGVEAWDSGEILHREVWRCNTGLDGGIGEIQPNNDIVNVVIHQLPPLFTCGCCGDPENPTPQILIEWRPDDYFDRDVTIDLVNFVDYVGDPGRMTLYTSDFGSINHVAPYVVPQTFRVACPADINDDQIVNTLDVLDALNLFSAGDGSLDWNEDGLVDTRDLVAFLNGWVIGCG